MSYHEYLLFGLLHQTRPSSNCPNVLRVCLPPCIFSWCFSVPSIAHASASLAPFLLFFLSRSVFLFSSFSLFHFFFFRSTLLFLFFSKAQRCREASPDQKGSSAFNFTLRVLFVSPLFFFMNVRLRRSTGCIRFCNEKPTYTRTVYWHTVVR